MHEITILFSTLNDGIFRILNEPQQIFERVNILIVHQITNQIDYAAAHVDCKSKGYQIIPLQEMGLTKSRNIALKNAFGSYLVIADDDLIYTNDADKKIIQAFSETNADIICMRLETKPGIYYKTYGNQVKRLRRNALAKVSSAEIIIKRAWWQTHAIYFDTEFGLGSKFHGGEEFIFLKEAEKNGAFIYFVPETLAYHPHISSGKVFTKENTIAKGAMFKKIFPILYPCYHLAYAIKKYPLYKKNFSLINFIKNLFTGSNQIKQK